MIVNYCFKVVQCSLEFVACSRVMRRRVDGSIRLMVVDDIHIRASDPAALQLSHRHVYLLTVHTCKGKGKGTYTLLLNVGAQI